MKQSFFSRSQNQIDDPKCVLLDMLRGISFLINEGKVHGLDIPAQLLIKAQKDIMYWSIASSGDEQKLNFADTGSADDQCINLALEFIATYAATEDNDLRKEMCAALKKSIANTNAPQHLSVHAVNS